MAMVCKHHKGVEFHPSHEHWNQTAMLAPEPISQLVNNNNHHWWVCVSTTTRTCLSLLKSMALGEPLNSIILRGARISVDTIAKKLSTISWVYALESNRAKVVSSTARHVSDSKSHENFSTEWRTKREKGGNKTSTYLLWWYSKRNQCTFIILFLIKVFCCSCSYGNKVKRARIGILLIHLHQWILCLWATQCLSTFLALLRVPALWNFPLGNLGRRGPWA